MSDTPKTDSRAGDVNYKGNFVYCDDGQLVEIEFARKLERENAALKQALNAQMQYQRELRTDRDRLDWLMTQKHIRYPFAPHDDGKVLRERIDAAMGEAVAITDDYINQMLHGDIELPHGILQSWRDMNNAARKEAQP